MKPQKKRTLLREAGWILKDDLWYPPAEFLTFRGFELREAWQMYCDGPGK